MHVSREIKGVALKIGDVFSFKFPLTLEFFAGVGFRIVNREYSDLLNRQLANGHNYPRYWDKYTAYSPQEGEEVLPHIALGVRVGYKIF